MNYPVLGNDDELSRLFKEGVTHAALGVGGFTDNKLRKKIFEKISKAGFEMISVIHPSCIIMPSVLIGKGVVAYPGVVVNSHVRIGENSILSAGTVVDHEAIIGNHALVSTNVSIGANTNLGNESLIAIGAVIAAGVNIGTSSLVAAGAVVIKDVPKNVRVAGIPAKIF